jgi:hypothetical protein
MESPGMRAKETVVCKTCGKEIPKSAAITPEGVNYAMHFCGPECLGRWKEEERRRKIGGQARP